MVSVLPINNSLNTTSNIPEEKTIFERAVIEAFKQKGPKEIHEKLSIALDEIRIWKTEINKSVDQKRHLLNKNIMDKLSRIQERKFFNVNMLIAKIYECLLDSEYYEILSNDTDLLIKFSNDILNLLEMIKSTLISKQLEIKCSSFLNYLYNFLGISEEQKNTIQELLNSFPTRNSSVTYKTFDEICSRIIKLCSSSTLDEKMEGINNLIEAYGSTYSLDEQFDLLIEKVPTIVKAIIHQPNPEYKDAYFQLGNFICSMLYATKYKIDAYIPQYRVNKKEINKNFFFLFKNSVLIDETTKDELSFLHDTVYELTSQKELLSNCENIYQICKMVVETLSIYESSFELQYISYLILKRVYFTFPQFRRNIDDNLAMILTNLCLFKESYEIDNSKECKSFIRYLLSDPDVDESIRHKLQKRIEIKKIDLDLEPFENEAGNEIEKESLKYSDFNLRIGYPSSLEVEAGCNQEKYLEVYSPNSIIYVGFATASNDINFELLLYQGHHQEERNVTYRRAESSKTLVSNNHVVTDNFMNDADPDLSNFKSIIKIERIDSSLNPVKIVLFVSEPGTYKIVWDNSFSWFTGKALRYRFSVLKPLSQLDLTRKVDFEELRAKMINHKTETSTISVENVPKREDVLINSTVNVEPKKLLMVKYEGKNVSFSLNEIEKKEAAMKNNNFYLSLPVILAKNSIRIFYNNIVTSLEFKGLEDEECRSFADFFEKRLTNFIENIENFQQKVIFLNIFSIEKPESGKEININLNNEQFYRYIYTKIGFFPQKLTNLSKNLHLFASNMADSCLIYLLYQKITNQIKFNNVIYIHFDKYKPQASMYFEGVITDNVSALEYDSSKSLLENTDNIISFISHVIVLFGNFEFSVSYTDIEESEFDQFFENLKEKAVEEFKDQSISIEKNSKEFLNSVFSYIHLFHIARETNK